MFRPALTVEYAVKRADLISKIRSFFLLKKVLEVETPLLSRGSGLDPHIDVYATEHFIDGTYSERKSLYLSTSPEFFMKRMLAAGYPSIFQICKAFRNGEVGDKHNPEFTILEWYRPQMGYLDLIDEVMELVNTLGNYGNYSVVTYSELFKRHLAVDPFRMSIEQCKELAEQHNLSPLFSTEIQEWLIYLFAMLIEPSMGMQQPEVLIEYPAEQAALAQTFINADGNHVARRFELYIKGIELCNGYEELTDADEQRRRFNTDIVQRKSMSKRVLPIDEHFLSALESGMPPCSGVALGLDRLIMLVLDKKTLSDVVAFPFGKV